jgi:hypothetical protein
MKKVLVVFLLFVSFSVFATEEMGRLVIELRDYEIDQYDSRWSLATPPRDHTYQEYELHIINTVSPKYSLPYSDLQKLMNRWITTNDGGRRVEYSSSNKRVIVLNYRLTDQGRWRPIFVHFPWLSLKETEVVKSDSFNRFDAFDNAAQILTLAWMGDEPGTKYSWDSTWDLNEEEVYWLGMSRKDEQGRPMHSFKVEIIFYKEGK